MNMENMMAFYRPGASHLHSLAVNRDGVPRCQYGGESLPELQAQYPDMLLLPFPQACDLIDAANTAKFCRAPVEQSAEQYFDALNVLPPRKWLRGTHTEAFFVSEALVSSIYTWHVRIGARYWRINRDGSRQPESIIAEVATAAGVQL